MHLCEQMRTYDRLSGKVEAAEQ